MAGGIQQPEVTTMNMNGRDVVVIDADLFSQIIDELQNLKMKLSQLSEVIQVMDILKRWLKGCGSSFEVKYCLNVQIFKVTTNETATLH